MNNKEMTEPPQFIKILIQIIQNNSHIISWIKNGYEIQIHNKKELIELMPKYFRHSQYKSLIRQLNLYNFHKISRKQGEIIFRHQYFIEGNQKQYHLIQRKKNYKNKSQLKNKQILLKEYQKYILMKFKQNCQIDNIQNIIRQLMIFQNNSFIRQNKLKFQMESLIHKIGKKSLSKSKIQKVHNFSKIIIEENNFCTAETKTFQNLINFPQQQITKKQISTQNSTLINPLINYANSGMFLHMFPSNASLMGLYTFNSNKSFLN